MNALIFVHKLWADHAPLLREEIVRTGAKSSRMPKGRPRRHSEICLKDAPEHPQAVTSDEPSGGTKRG